MTTIASPPSLPLNQQQHIVLERMSWSFYERLLDEIGDRAIRVTFDRGSLEIMSPLPKHEKWKARIARLIEMLSFELKIPVEPWGSTTFKREDREQGIEPDECYYIRNPQRMRDKDEVDLLQDPPPDLAIEVDITSRSIRREPIYAGLGVPELWRFEGEKLTVLGLRRDGSYELIVASRAFPFLPMATFQQFLLRLGTEDQIVVLDEFRNWVRTLRV